MQLSVELFDGSARMKITRPNRSEGTQPSNSFSEQTCLDRMLWIKPSWRVSLTFRILFHAECPHSFVASIGQRKTISIDVEKNDFSTSYRFITRWWCCCQRHRCLWSCVAPSKAKTRRKKQSHKKRAREKKTEVEFIPPRQAVSKPCDCFLLDAKRKRKRNQIRHRRQTRVLPAD